MNIYVGNLMPEVTEEELRREFAAYGEVGSVIIMNDKYLGSGQPAVYGYVEMSSKIEGVVAINNLSGKNLKGRVINVIEALPLSDKQGMLSANNHKTSRYARRKKRNTIS